MDAQVRPTRFVVWRRSLLSATYEIGFIVLPGVVWALALLSTEAPSNDVLRLPAWSFIALSCWFAILRDGIKTFHRLNHLDDRWSRDLIVTLSLIGVTGTTVLLTCNVLHSRGTLPHLWPVFHTLVFGSLITSLAMAWSIKMFLIQRVEFGHYAGEEHTTTNG